MMMPLDHMAEELDQVVVDFRNQCLREGLRVLEPDQWMDLFKSHLAGVDLARQYEEAQKWLAERFPEDQCDWSEHQ